MPINGGQANAVATILRWVGYRDPHGGGRVPTDEQAADALVLLGTAAGKQLMMGYGEDAIRAAVATHAELRELCDRQAEMIGSLYEQAAQERSEIYADLSRRYAGSIEGLKAELAEATEKLAALRKPYELLAAVRDRDVHMDRHGVSRHAITGEVGVDVSIPIANLQRRGLVELIVMPAPVDRWTLTDAGRQLLEVHDPSRCHYVNLSGRACRRSGPHADWCCDFGQPSPVEVNVLSAAEWSAAVHKALDELGLTYDDLVEMSRKRDFTSIEARKLWLAIGGKRPQPLPEASDA